jgi:hypothetical protein
MTPRRFPPPCAHATTMFFPHFVGDACTMLLMRTGVVERIEHRHDLLTIFWR